MIPFLRPMSHPTYVVQSAADERLFLIVLPPHANRRDTHVLLRGMLDEAHEFASSFEAEDFAQRHLVAGSYVVRTMVAGYLRPAHRKEMVTR
jgi:hypothetical protein